MPIKENPKQEVKCPCGKNTVVDVKPAIAYCELTRFKCECGRVYHIIDHRNGCISYYEASEDVDRNYLEQVRNERQKMLDQLKDITFPPAQVKGLVYRMTRELPLDFSIGGDDYDVEVVLHYESENDENELIKVMVGETPVFVPVGDGAEWDLGEELHNAWMDWFTDNVPAPEEGEQTNEVVALSEAMFDMIWKTMQDMNLA